MLHTFLAKLTNAAGPDSLVVFAGGCALHLYITVVLGETSFLNAGVPNDLDIFVNSHATMDAIVSVLTDLFPTCMVATTINSTARQSLRSVGIASIIDALNSIHAQNQIAASEDLQIVEIVEEMLLQVNKIRDQGVATMGSRTVAPSKICSITLPKQKPMLPPGAPLRRGGV